MGQDRLRKNRTLLDLLAFGVLNSARKIITLWPVRQKIWAHYFSTSLRSINWTIVNQASLYIFRMTQYWASWDWNSKQRKSRLWSNNKSKRRKKMSSVIPGRFPLMIRFIKVFKIAINKLINMGLGTQIYLLLLKSPSLGLRSHKLLSLLIL